MVLFLWTTAKHQQTRRMPFNGSWWEAWTPKKIPSKSILSIMYMYSFCYSFGVDFNRYVSLVTIFANTSLHVKSQVRNSLPSHPVRYPRSALFFLCFFASRFDRNDSIYDIFRSKSMNILNHRAKKIAKKSCIQNTSFEPKGPETLHSSLGLAGS